MEMAKIEMKIRDFTFGFAKGILLRCERLPFGGQKDSFRKVKGKLLKAKMGIFRTILETFWTKESGPKICKPRFPLSINDLVNGLKTRVFETEIGVGGFQMLIFDLFVKIFPNNKESVSVNRNYLFLKAEINTPRTDIRGLVLALMSRWAVYWLMNFLMSRQAGPRPVLWSNP
jgi:hypothetical protein